MKTNPEKQHCTHAESEPEVIPRLVKIDEVCRILGFQKTYVYNLVATGRMQPLKFGRSRKAAVRWLLSDVLAYIQSVADERKPPKPPSTSLWE